MAPFDLFHTVHSVVFFSAYFLIGIGFGFALELSGFGDSRRLAAQFYLKDMTVLKVMFTAIIVAASLIYLSSAMGWLDIERVWVNPTYLWPGILGGIIMGVGFVIGGFCPGTSLVAAATLKIDGVFFAIGVTFGIFAFGETVDGFQAFHDSSFMGRFTLADWLGLPVGVVLIGLVLLAFMMFFLAEISEQVFGRKIPLAKVRLLPGNGYKLIGMGGLVLLVTVTAIIGQPTPQERWQQMAETEEPKLAHRDLYVHPGEVAELMQNASLYTTVLDVRPERDFNLFHLRGAQPMALNRLTDPDVIRRLKSAPANTVFILMSNDERDATLAYKTLRAQGILNLYVVEGGVNNWLKIYPIDPCIARPLSAEETVPLESLRYSFFQSVGGHSYASHPGCACKEYPTDCFLSTHVDTHKRPTITHDPDIKKLEYTRKVKIKKKTKPQGGCG